MWAELLDVHYYIAHNYFRIIADCESVTQVWAATLGKRQTGNKLSTIVLTCARIFLVQRSIKIKKKKRRVVIRRLCDL